MLTNNKVALDELISKLKMKKNQILKDQEIVKQQMNGFYQRMKEMLIQCQKETARQFNQEILVYHQKLGEIIKELGKGKFGPSQEGIEKAMELVNYRIFDGLKVDEDKLLELLKSVYYIKVGILEKENEQNNSFLVLADISQSQSNYSEKLPANEIVLEKLQTQRDYYQIRQEQLLQRIKQLQSNLSRKGINIKEMSKSYLQQRCSKWALDRLRQEKRILVEKIGEASQQTMRQDTLISEYETEIKRLNGIIYDIGGRSVLGNNTVKNSSIIMESQTGKQYRGSEIYEINRQKQIQLQQKNEQLRIQITHHIQTVQQQSQNNRRLQSKIQEYQQQILSLENQKQDLKNLNKNVNNDYEVCLRKKAAFQQEIAELKINVEQLNDEIREERQSYKNTIADYEIKELEIIAKVKQSQQLSKQEINKLEARIKSLNVERQAHLKTIEEISTKKGEEINYKQLLNDQIARLFKENATISLEIQEKQEKLFLIREQNTKLTNEIKLYSQKLQSNKKEVNRYKKANKQIEKKLSQLQNKLTQMQNLEYKMAQLQQNFTFTHSQFIKYKQTCDKKYSIHEKIIGIMKERFSIQLTSLLNEDIIKNKNKKGQNKSEMIEKYIQEMINFSNKTAQVKQLKEEIRDLKESKQAKNLNKKNRTNIDDTITGIQSGIWSFSSKVLQERLTSQKQLFQQKINELKQILAKQQALKESIKQKLQDEKAITAQMRNKFKQQSGNQQLIKVTKQLEEKIEKFEQQVKRLKARNKKLQNQVAESQSQIKTKKELVNGLRNQIKSKDDSIAILQKEISASKNQIEKTQRNSKQMLNKQEILRDTKETLKQLQIAYQQLKLNNENLQDKLKQLNRQLSKKQDAIKEIKIIQQKDVKTKEQSRIRQLNNTVNQQKQTIRKLKVQIDRKDEIIKNSKNKYENKNKENQQIMLKSQRQFEKILKDKQILERKLEISNAGFKKQELKNNSLTWSLKKIYELCCNTRQQYQAQPNKRQSTQYYTGSSASSNAIKVGTPSNIKSLALCEGLSILNLRPEDLEGCMGVETTAISKPIKSNDSWSLTSPILNKRRQKQKQEILIQGLQQLQKLVSVRDLNSNQILQIFRKALQK